MKTLITGGTGFVGSTLTRRLLQLSHDVTLVSRRGKSELNNQENLHHLLADTTKEGEFNDNYNSRSATTVIPGSPA